MQTTVCVCVCAQCIVRKAYAVCEARTFCRRPRQSRDIARLARSEKASFWIVLLSGATPEASFITECIRELPRVHLDPDATPGPLPQRVLHAGRSNKKFSFD